MRLKFLGATQEVTGSCYLIEVGGHRVLVDFGMHQGENEEANYDPLSFDPTSIDALLLTHAHIDHSGRIPLLARSGFKGKVYCTLPTAELVELLWADSANLMKEDAAWRSRKNLRKGLPAVEPLYDETDIGNALKLLYPISYDDRYDVVPGLSVRFRDAGHIIGSSILEVFLTEGDRNVKVVFSGDLGPAKTVMERAPAEINEADYVLIESTYGDRDHKTNEETRKEFQELMADLLAHKSKIYIPTFVVDRAQRIMYELALLRDQGIGTDLPVYFDSPLGVKATEVYQNHLDMMSQEIQMYRRSGKNPFLDSVEFVSTVEDSQKINTKSYGVVMAGSGMVNGGRIVHHLKNGIWNPNNHVVFVGYQARGTAGRRIVDGAKTIRLAGEEVAVKAQIHTIGGFSAHADRTDLILWAEHFRLSMPQFFVVHGEPQAANALQEALEGRGFSAQVADVDLEIELEPRQHGKTVSQAQRDSKAAGDVIRQVPESEEAQEDGARGQEEPAAQTNGQSKKGASGKIDTSAEGKPTHHAEEKTSRQESDEKRAPRSARKQRSQARQSTRALERLSDRLTNLYDHLDGGMPDDVLTLVTAAATLLETAEQKMSAVGRNEKSEEPSGAESAADD
ncbi:MBL fold metallo-hydrolase [Jonquetella anthropi]|uniref:MBL fold metallo-hydrolase n=1 Tax=Jonquetella anthropi TaxID=428712 RepID=UPI0003186331|nr:MBL fold metallo-hydrolase [Jonquetella anthropi]